MKTEACPCQSGQTYAACCEPFHRGKAKPETAEQLMRSRYCAYAKGEIDYIEKTHHSKSEGEFDRASAEAWSNSVKWLGLEVLKKEQGAASDDKGKVEFIARYEIKGAVHVHHEHANFEREGDRWAYMDGEVYRAPVTRSNPKVGRNDPCLCGSGKKFKKCCEVAA